MPAATLWMHGDHVWRLQIGSSMQAEPVCAPKRKTPSLNTHDYLTEDLAAHLSGFVGIQEGECQQHVQKNMNNSC